MLVVVSCLASGAVHASEGCDPGFVEQYHESLRLVDSLLPDKGGQMRVTAADGSEFTAGQVRWMQGQLRLVDRACARHDPATATRSLYAVRELLKAHQR
jgi:hypothetical protein